MMIRFSERMAAGHVLGGSVKGYDIPFSPPIPAHNLLRHGLVTGHVTPTRDNDFEHPSVMEATMLTRRAMIAIALALATPALAHHGWRWTADGEFELSGIITAAELGNPHGLLTVDADGEIWTVEVGQPWRNERAGVTDAMLAPGEEIVARGHRSADPAQLVMKAERLIIGGETFDLYPDRS
jgi:hypothetical protein